MAETSIEWTHPPGFRGETWNPINGCEKISPGCRECYAEKIAARFGGPGQPFHGTVDERGRFIGPILVPEKLAEPLKRRAPTCWFVNSMSDLFHEAVPDEYIAAVFGVMAASPRHRFIVLTKRAERMRRWFQWLDGVVTKGEADVQRLTGTSLGLSGHRLACLSAAASRLQTPEGDANAIFYGVGE